MSRKEEKRTLLLTIPNSIQPIKPTQLLTLNISYNNIQFGLPNKITREVWDRIGQFEALSELMVRVVITHQTHLYVSFLITLKIS